MIQSVVRVESYDQAAMNEAVCRHFDALNIEEMLKPNLRVAIKPNLVGARRPDTAATTHPALVRAVILWLRARGVKDITVCDSPGGAYTPQHLDSVYRATGMAELADIAHLNRDTGFVSVRAEEGISAFNIINPIAQADLVINIAKLKTHSMTLLSAGIKNLFGCIPGLQKPELHYRHPEVDGFSKMLVSLARTVNPAVTLIDAVECMEGDGPTGGTVRHLGLMLAARDLFTQDVLAARMMGIDRSEVAMLRHASSLGLIDEEVIWAGDEPIYVQPPFKRPRAAGVDFTGHVPPFLRKPARFVMAHLLKPYPRVDGKRCIGCGKCAESCPAHIIVIENKKARFTRKGCISCFCCQEMCPVKAIGVTRSVSRFISGREERTCKD